MKKQTQLLLGLAAVGVVGYLIWKNQQSDKKNYVNVKQNQFFTPSVGYFHK